MESHGVPGEIQVTQSTRDLLGDNYLIEERGVIEVKGKGPMKTYLLKGKRREKREKTPSK
jgi:class 3 adenylate cyclase